MNLPESPLVPEADCGICRQTITKMQPLWRVTLGLTETPEYVGAPGSLVESTDEITVCQACRGKVTERFDAFLQDLWEMRAPDPPGTVQGVPWDAGSHAS